MSTTTAVDKSQTERAIERTKVIINEAHSSSNHRPCNCINGGGIPKQYYKTQADADDAAKVINDNHPDQPTQSPYYCEEGGVWHLTSKPRQFVVNAPGSLFVNTRMHAAAKAAEAAGAQRRQRVHYPEEVKLDAFKLRDQGFTHKQIADKLETNPANISNWFRDADLKAKYEKSKVPTSIEQFASEEQKLERQLADLRAKKQAAIEAKQWKLLSCWDGRGVLLKKEGNQMGVMLEDAEELIVVLDDYLKGLRKQ
jgi:transposase-like protein